MPTLLNTFETGAANGTTVTAAGSGASAAGNPADLIDVGAGNAMTYSDVRSAHGTLSALITMGQSSGQPAYWEWSTSLVTAPYSGATYSRIYVHYDVLPSNGELAILRGLLGTNQRWATRLRNDGKLVVWGDASTQAGVSTTTLTPGSWWRVEASAVASATQASTTIEVRIYAGDSLTPTETLSYSGIKMGGPIDRVRCGVGNFVGLATAWTIHMDDVGASTVGWLGPAIALPAVTHSWIGAVTSTSATVSCGLENVASARLVVSASPDLSAPLLSPAGTPDADGIVKLTCTGLAPNTLYHYGVQADGALIEAGRGSFTSDPTPGSPTSFSIAFGSCAQTNSNSETFQAIAEREGPYGRARRMLYEGDIHYRDFGAGATYADVVAQWKSSLAPARMRQLTSTVPTTYTWDNHDWGGPNSDAAAPAGPLVAAAYRQVVPHYPLATSGDTAIHQSWVIGRVRFIQLDTRSQRSPRTDAESPSKTMLGPEQKQWFRNELLQPEPLKVVVSGIYWRRDSTTGDRWGSYATEWAEIRDWVAANASGIGKVIVVSGDRHALYADDGSAAADTGGTYWPNVSGAPFDQGTSAPFEVWSHGYYYTGGNMRAYGWLDIQDSGASITVTYSGITALDGATRLSMTLDVPAASALPARWGIHL
ncbi:alkaline phosphatase D family protein [Micromonospora sp. NPDC047730]|uniref:alkaline phosphatase D family protein n=1 Tax=Micromonospora sp. NPDC047730 TaxID=3364253 RepID=UPI00372132A6